MVRDARDGLRTGDRRVLLVMNGPGLAGVREYRRSASIVGEVRQRFPGQGSRSAYNALVRMAQDFVTRYPLIDGQGNFGSIDGDPAAGSSYTEARLTEFGAAVLSDDPHAVDGGVGLGEPSVLPSSVPNLLVNGASAMRPIVPPHNLREVVGALIHLIEHPDATDSELRRYIKGPDFPTGGCIVDVAGIRDYQETGRGQITIRARTEIEAWQDETRIVVSEVPFLTNVWLLCESIATAVRDGRIDGIRELRNESGWDGLRLVMTTKPGVDPGALLTTLYKLTPMRTTLRVALVASVLDPQTGEPVPRTMSLKELLQRYIAHRDECIARRPRSGGRGGDAAPTAARMQILKEELTRTAARFGDARRTEIVAPVA